MDTEDVISRSSPLTDGILHFLIVQSYLITSIWMTFYPIYILFLSLPFSLPLVLFSFSRELLMTFRLSHYNFKIDIKFFDHRYFRDNVKLARFRNPRRNPSGFPRAKLSSAAMRICASHANGYDRHREYRPHVRSRFRASSATLCSRRSHVRAS